MTNKTVQLTEKDIARFWSKVDKDGPLWTDLTTGETSHCWEWTSAKDRGGYGLFWVGGLTLRVSRLSYEYFNDDSLGTLNALHKCDNPPCINPSHLFKGTSQDNAIDRETKGRRTILLGNLHWSRQHPEWVARGERHRTRTHPEMILRGENHGNAKLTAVQVDEIRALRKRGVKLKEICKQFHISMPQASRLVNGKRWSHSA